MANDLESGTRRSSCFSGFRSLEAFPPKPCAGGHCSYAGSIDSTSKSSKRIVLCDIKLEDVLDDVHDHPLGLASFESYLNHIHCVENLYFIIWLQSYIQLYEEIIEKIEDSPTRDSASHSSTSRLHSTFMTGINQFILSNSPFELNLSSNIRTDLMKKVQQLAFAENDKPKNSILAPADFESVGVVVMNSLQVSFQDYLTAVFGNTGLRSGIYAQLVGIFIVFIGLVPLIISLCLHASRGIRFIGIPFIFFGLAVGLGGRRKTCLIIFLSGKRKFFPWETKAKDGTVTTTTKQINITADSKPDFAELLEQYSHSNVAAPGPSPTLSSIFNNILGPLTEIGEGSAALFAFKQNQIIKRTLIYALVTTIGVAVVFGSVPTPKAH